MWALDKLKVYLGAGASDVTFSPRFWQFAEPNGTVSFDPQHSNLSNFHTSNPLI
jgi:hypothetical protein